MLQRALGICVLLLSLTACSLGSTPVEEVAMVFDTPPTIEIASPLAGSIYRENTPVNILARIENAGSDVASVELRVGEEIIGQMSSPNESGAAAFTITSSWPAVRTGQQTISIIVSRTDGVQRAVESVTIEVRGMATPTPTMTPTTEIIEEPTATETQPDTTQPESPPVDNEQVAPPTVEEAAPPTPIPPTPTSTAPRVRITQGANVRQGPSTTFQVISTLAAGAEADILAKTADESWFKIRLSNVYNTSGWVARVVVEVLGNTSALPVEAGPPTPVPQPTAVPVTQPPAGQPTSPPAAPTGADLVVDGVPVINPHPFVCAQASTINVTIKNIGTQRAEGIFVRVEDIYNNNVSATTSAPIVGGIDPGATASVELYLTVSTNINEGHITRVTVDPANAIAETNESNNVYNSPLYSLAAGGC